MDSESRVQRGSSAVPESRNVSFDVLNQSKCPNALINSHKTKIPPHWGDIF